MITLSRCRICVYGGWLDFSKAVTVRSIDNQLLSAAISCQRGGVATHQRCRNPRATTKRTGCRAVGSLERLGELRVVSKQHGVPFHRTLRTTTPRDGAPRGRVQSRPFSADNDRHSVTSGSRQTAINDSQLDILYRINFVKVAQQT